MKTIKFFRSTVLVALAVCASVAQANDSAAKLGVGGLAMSQSADIEMVSEDLYVSENQIKVDYVFKNHAPKDVKILVAFPLPELDLEHQDEVDMNLPSKSDNFVDFKVTVDGLAVNFQKSIKAKSGDKDVTALLQENGIPFFGPDLATVAKLTPAQLALLPLTLTSGDYEYNGVKQKSEPILTLKWKVSVSFYWEQTFPAGKEVRISHQYIPVVGRGFAGNFTDETTKEVFRFITDKRKSDNCIDAQTEKAIDKMLLMHEGNTYSEVEYILTTANSWRGPIKKFRLSVDKLSPSNIVSLCAENVNKISPTTFVSERTDYVPQKNLDILFVQPGMN